MGFQNVSNAHGGFESLKNIGLPVIQKTKVNYLYDLKTNSIYLVPKIPYYLKQN